MTPKEPWWHICGILIFDFWFKKFWCKISTGLQKMCRGLQKLAGVPSMKTSLGVVGTAHAIRGSSS